jgi:hypothetical protein
MGHLLEEVMSGHDPFLKPENADSGRKLNRALKSVGAVRTFNGRDLCFSGFVPVNS